MSSGPENDLETARRVVQIEREALDALSSSLDANFSAAVDAIVGCAGYLIVAGVGKSGHIGQKIAATMADVQQVRLATPSRIDVCRARNGCRHPIVRFAYLPGTRSERLS